MKILLDSHSLVWFLTGDRKCSARARVAIEAPEATKLLSAVSAWEIATKVRSGKWPEAAGIAADIERIAADNGFAALPVTLAHGRLAGLLPARHRDPFDRMLAAQAQIESAIVVTADPAFRAFEVETLW